MAIDETPAGSRFYGPTIYDWVLGMGLPLITKLTFFVLALFALIQLAHGQEAKQKSAQQPPAVDAAGGGVLAKRMAKIEEQIIDLQVVLGTLQSIVTGQGRAAPAQPAAAATYTSGQDDGGRPPVDAQALDLSMRINVIETQIRALAGQMELITQQLMVLQTRLGPSGAGNAPAAQPPMDPVAPQPPGNIPPDDRRGEGSPADAHRAASTYGTLTVTPKQNLMASRPAHQALNAALGADRADTSRAIYEQAYRHLLRRDSTAAKAGFKKFLTNQRSGSLAASAQYWLSKKLYDCGQYRAAADAFLKGYRHDRTGSKTTNSLLKLGMSLHQLGEHDAAYATFGELAEKFPKAPAYMTRQAGEERWLVGC